MKVLEYGPIVLVEDIGQGFMDAIQTPEGVAAVSGTVVGFVTGGIAGAKVKAKINASKAEVGKAAEDIKGNTSAAKLGSINQTVKSFTREDIINALDGVTEKSTEIANAIRNKDIGINALGDDLFESYLGCSSDTVAMQVGDQIYVRSSSSSLFSDVVHEGTHAIDYLNGIEESIISSWTGETSAYSAERLFQIESGMPVQFLNEEDMMVHIWSNYSK